MNPNEVEVLRDELRRELMAELFRAMDSRRASKRRHSCVSFFAFIVSHPLPRSYPGLPLARASIFANTSSRTIFRRTPE